ncbi:universal stress protein [Peristeroidobacter agariperforans]|uniref:universal stress protein n=1 Tax=Peristeroidobacter agariperforans TaxID=268404 RepID=UPI00101BAF8C|nr:universal stress protein [Peristeroidobacter agariperforans]
MNPIQNILVIVDPTAQQQPAVAKGAILAKQLAARLDLFVCETKAARDLRLGRHLRLSPQAPFEEKLIPWLESLAEPLRREGIEVTTEVVSADPLHAELVERVKHTCAELVIKDTHHHSIAQRTFLTNTDWELIRSCPVPLLLVKATPWSTAHRIGAALDPGHMDDKPRLLDRCILQEAARFAAALGGEVHPIHAYIPAAMIAAATMSVPPIVIDIPAEALEEERKSKLKELTAITSDYRFPEKNIHLETGGVVEVLCRLARDCGIDIMAMGALSRRGVRRILIGGTAEDVLEQLPCDLLVVKSPNFAEMLVL